MLAMTLNPEVQAKAKAEIQRVIGPDRLPSLEDREKLPYVEACIKETLRWRPGAPLSIPRRTSKADIYNGIYPSICIHALTHILLVGYYIPYIFLNNQLSTL